MRAKPRRGAILAVTIVCLIVAVAMLTAILSEATARRRQTRVALWQVQAQWLAESGLERAAWRLAGDPNYSGERWTLPAEEFHGDAAAAVTIEVEAVAGQPRRRLVRAQADYPDDPHDRARQSKQTVVELRP
jgi:type II secretory pathway component PulK